MTREAIHSIMPAPLRRFAADQRGVSAVEFAILLPLMLTLYLGGVEVSQAASADRKTTLVAHTVGDLVAQATDITSGGADDVLAAASTIAAPFPVSNLKITISSVCIDSTGKIATIAWSRASSNATARSGTVTSSIDSRLMVAGTSLIWGEASYDYRPTIGWTIPGTLTMSGKTFLRPRLGKAVTLNWASGCPCPYTPRPPCSRDRQGGRRLDLLHGEAGGDVLQRHRGDQPFVEGVIARDVGNDDAQHVVDIAGHAVEFQDLRHGADQFREAGQPFARMVLGLH